MGHATNIPSMVSIVLHAWRQHHLWRVQIVVFSAGDIIAIQLGEPGDGKWILPNWCMREWLPISVYLNLGELRYRDSYDSLQDVKV